MNRFCSVLLYLSFRIQILEIENKRFASKKQTDIANGDQGESLLAEINSLKKDVQSSERLVKQAEVKIYIYIYV